MKIFVVFFLMLTTGVAGLIFFFGETESIVRLILSKPIGLLLLFISYLLHNRLKVMINTNIH